MQGKVPREAMLQGGQGASDAKAMGTWPRTVQAAKGVVAAATNAVMLSGAHNSAPPMVAQAVADLEGLVAAGAVAMAMVQAVAMESAR